MKMKMLFVLLLTLAVSGCTSMQTAPVCPKPPTPAWANEPAPNLLPLLDRIITPSEAG